MAKKKSATSTPKVKAKAAKAPVIEKKSTKKTKAAAKQLFVMVLDGGKPVVGVGQVNKETDSMWWVAKPVLGKQRLFKRRSLAAESFAGVKEVALAKLDSEIKALQSQLSESEALHKRVKNLRQGK